MSKKALAPTITPGLWLVAYKVTGELSEVEILKVAPSGDWIKLTEGWIKKTSWLAAHEPLECLEDRSVEKLVEQALGRKHTEDLPRRRPEDPYQVRPSDWATQPMCGATIQPGITSLGCAIGEVTHLGGMCGKVE